MQLGILANFDRITILRELVLSRLFVRNHFQIFIFHRTGDPVSIN